VHYGTAVTAAAEDNHETQIFDFKRWVRGQIMENNISAWEDEGGSLSDPLRPLLTGSVAPMEWAEGIRVQVNAEFDRFSNSLQTVAMRQSDQNRLKTFAIMLILEEKRGEVLANGSAGCFIHGWQELRDQIRTMIMNDPRYEALNSPVPC
jgi:hypothetical protein